MKPVKSCEFHIDTASVEVKYLDGTMISIYCPGVEDEIADNMYERSELDWLIYNEPITYVNLVLNSGIEEYVKGQYEHDLKD